MATRRVFRVGTAGAVTALVLSLSACFGGADVTLTAPPRPTPAQRLWSITSKPFSNPVNIGGVAVLYVKRGHALRIVGLDPATGKVLWSDAAGPSFIVRSEALQPADIGGKVAYYRMPDSATGTLEAPMVIAEPRTGKKLAVSTPQLFRSVIRPCPGAPAAACVRVGGERRAPTTMYQFSVAKPVLTKLKRVPQDARVMAPDGLVDLGGDVIEELGRIDRGKLVWRKAMAELLGPGITTIGGEEFTSYPDQDVFVGTAWVRSWTDKVDLKKSVSAGFKQSDGTPLWKETSTYMNCFGSGSTIPPGRFTSTVPLRCRYTGVLTYVPGKDWTASKDFKVRLERFDVRTGKAVWSTPIGTAPIMSLLAAGYASVGDDRHLVIDTGKTKVSVDLVTGRASKVANSTVLWCHPGSYIDDYRVPIYTNGEPNYYVRSIGLTFPCTSNGKLVATPNLAFVPASVSAQFDGGISVYAAPKGVTAYRFGSAGPSA